MHITNTPAPRKGDEQLKYVLALLRAAAARCRLLVCDIDFIGHSLEAGMISAEQAIAMLRDAGGENLVLRPPELEAPC